MANTIEIIQDTITNSYQVKVGVERVGVAMNPQNIIREVRYQICSAITEKVMQKLSPAIDKAIKDSFQEQ